MCSWNSSVAAVYESRRNFGPVVMSIQVRILYFKRGTPQHSSLTLPSSLSETSTSTFTTSRLILCFVYSQFERPALENRSSFFSSAQICNPVVVDRRTAAQSEIFFNLGPLSRDAVDTVMSGPVIVVFTKSAGDDFHRTSAFPFKHKH